MRCEEVRERLADYLAGTVGPPAGDALEHLSSCKECGDEFVELTDLWSDLGELESPRPDSALLRTRFADALTIVARESRVKPRSAWDFSPRVVRTLFAVAASLAVAVAVWQTGVTFEAGSVSGVAQDIDGVALSGVKITATNDSGIHLAAVTRADGSFEFRDVPAGKYSVTADLLGFQTSRYSGLAIGGRNGAQLPFKLQAGAVSEAVELGGSPANSVVTQMAMAFRTQKSEIADKSASVPRVAADAAAELKESVVGGPNDAVANFGLPDTLGARIIDKRAAVNLRTLDRLQFSPGGRATEAERLKPQSNGIDGLALLELYSTRNQYEASLSGRFSYSGSGYAPSYSQTYALPPAGLPSAPSGGGGGGRGGSLAEMAEFGAYADSQRMPKPAAAADSDMRRNTDDAGTSRLLDQSSATFLSAIAEIEMPIRLPRIVDRDGKGILRESLAKSATIVAAPVRRDGPWDVVPNSPFISVDQTPLSTFSTDVDTASYSNVRRYLTNGDWPPQEAVRIEELINYFRYDYPQGSAERPVAATMEAASAPWSPDHRLVRIGIKAREVRMDRKSVNLVFLVDVSGSMSSPNKLPLLKSGLRMLVDRLTENDTVTIVTYADSSGVALPPTNGSHKDTLLRAIDGLSASGSTNGGAGIQTAYEAAQRNFIRGGVNRVILATDGDFNVGIVDTNQLVRLIEDKAKTGVFLSVLGFGSDNLQDTKMEQLADHGNGNYAYIDTLSEARKVLIDEMAGTLMTVAKDVKIQVEFNPAEVASYRLIGYENRALAARDFNDDRKDAGDMGSGQTVTALYEVIPRNVTPKDPAGEPLRFQPKPEPKAAERKGPQELLNLKVRYKEPEGEVGKTMELQLVDRGQAFSKASVDFRFATAVAAFGSSLRNAPWGRQTGIDLGQVLEIAQGSRGEDRNGLRSEFIQLVERAVSLRRWR